MKWQGRRQSSNVEDRRGQSSSGQGIGGFNPTLLGPLVKFFFQKLAIYSRRIFSDFFNNG